MPIIWAQVRVHCFLTLFLLQAFFARPLNLSESHQLFTFLQAGSSSASVASVVLPSASLPLSFFPSYFFMYSLYSFVLPFFRAQSAQAFLQYIEASFLKQRLLALPINFSESEAHHPINPM